MEERNQSRNCARKVLKEKRFAALGSLSSVGTARDTASGGTGTFSLRTARAQFQALLLLISLEGSRLHLFLLSRSYRD
jgi:hypothetical protein